MAERFAEARAKINWALAVTGRRADGYHALDMLMQEISLCDEVYAEPSDRLELRVDGSDLPADESNLVLRAAMALREAAGCTAGARLRLVKRVPSQAGLGGGSADCAAVLRLLNGLWGLGLGDAELERIGLRLGADVPFCLRGGLCRVGGIGEELTPIWPAPQAHLVVVKPDGGVPTGAAFRLWDEGLRKNSVISLDNAQKALSNGDWDALGACAGNDLQPAAERIVPEIALAVARLRAEGALFAAMSGSGSAVFGVFPSAEEAKRAAGRIGRGAVCARTVA